MPPAPFDPSAPLIGGVAPPPTAQRSRWTPVVIHIAGSVLTLGALAVGLVGLIIIGIAGLHCGPEPVHLARDLKVMTAVLALVVAAVPAGWALLCRKQGGRSWQVWAVAAILLVLTGMNAVMLMAPTKGAFFGHCSGG